MKNSKELREEQNLEPDRVDLRTWLEELHQLRLNVKNGWEKCPRNQAGWDGIFNLKSGDEFHWTEFHWNPWFS